jgi:hypothetical protein
LPRSIAASELVQRGYAVYRYFLRGFVLVRIDRAEVRTTPSGLCRALGHLSGLLPQCSSSSGCLKGATYLHIRWFS